MAETGVRNNRDMRLTQSALRRYRVFARLVREGTVVAERPYYLPFTSNQYKETLDTYADGDIPEYTPVDEFGRLQVGGSLMTRLVDAAESEDAAVVTGSVGYLPTNTEYETVAASASNQTIGPTGATGDYLSHIIVIPATTSPGAVKIKDGSNGQITVFAGGASSVSNLVPFVVYLNLTSTVGAWQVDTGSNVSVIAVGNFT